MTFRLDYSDSFLTDFAASPKKIQKAVTKTVSPVLKTQPGDTGHQMIKKMKGSKSLFRYRVSESYRLIYDVDKKKKTVTARMLGDRKIIYKRADFDPESGPGKRIRVRKPEILEKEPTASERGRLAMELASEEENYTPDDPLPRKLTPRLLAQWGISKEHQPEFEKCANEGELLELSKTVPQDEIEIVLNQLYPKTLDEVLDEAVYQSDSPPEDVLAGLQGRDLRSFLLRLDEDQQKIVDAYKRKGRDRPWMIRGGPGTGKSVVALYCLREVAKRTKPGETKILFTTYTNALVRVAEKLLETIYPEVDLEGHVCFSTADRLATEIVSDNRGRAQDPDFDDVIKKVLFRAEEEENSLEFSETDTEFIREEIRWVILGGAVKTIENYLNADRSNRGRVLDEKERREIWRIFELVMEGINNRNLTTFEEIVSSAAEGAQPIYDYIFVDEVQDLSASAFSLCRKLVKSDKRIFVTGDLNQSIYGQGGTSSLFGKVKRRLKSIVAREKITSLSRNYRSTTEIWDAVNSIAAGEATRDRESLTTRPFRSGEPPELKRYGDKNDEVDFLADFIHQGLKVSRASLGCAAILCRKWKDAEEIAKRLPDWCNAKPMVSRNLDIDHPGVKVLTMHAAKGLQFPVVVVSRVNDGVFPELSEGEQSDNEKENRERRLFFVACGRAMNSLAVMTKTGQESSFVELLSSDYWEEA